MMVNMINSAPPARIRLSVVFLGGYLFGFYLVCVLFYLQDWDKYPVVVGWLVSSFTYPWLSMILGNFTLSHFALPFLYGVYAVIGYKRLRQIGFLLFVSHYLLAVILMGILLYFANAEFSDFSYAVLSIGNHPTVLLYGIPFLIGNYLYLQRLSMRNRRTRGF